jgi:aspartyl protease family protein
MRRPSLFLWLILGIGGVAAILLLTRDGALGTDGLDGNQIARAIVLVAILIFVLAGVIGRGSFGRAARYAVIWSAIVVVALVGYTYRDELGAVLERVSAELFPGDAASTQTVEGGTVVIGQSRRSNHFIAVATVNNAPIEMLVDTGASVVTLTPEDARLAGISTRGLRYDVRVETANGTARAAPVVLDRIAIGPIEERRVAALVAEEGTLEMSLLGLNFLQSLSSFTFAGKQLILTP